MTQPHRHRRPKPSTSSSSSTLVLFASIFTSTSAAGYPLCSPSPPDFLCPRLNDIKLAAPGPSSYLQNVPTPTVNIRQPRAVPDSYSRGDDGRWRKLSQYSFYGSTICLCDDDTTINSVVTADILTVSPSGTGTGTTDTDSLPTGWSNIPSSSTARTSLILTLSLILAGIIATFISSCIYWRKRRKLRAEKDLERKAASKRSVDYVEKENARVKLWVKASARWKDNVKHSARRRRTSRLVSSPSHINGSSVSLGRPSSPSSIHSHHSSIMSSRSSTPTQKPSSVVRRESIDELECATSDSGSVHSQNGPSPFPPAYQGGGAAGGGPPRSSIPKSPSIHEFPDPNPSVITDLPPPPVLDEEGPQYTPVLHSAHVATDDKAVLQLIVIMGSEPVGGSHPHDQGSAPILYDDDDVESLEHVAQQLEYDDRDASPSAMFPAPPQPQASSKGKMVQYLDFEDLDVELPSGPSAPPFDESLSRPSAPLLDEGEALVPFAPPLEQLEIGSVPPVEDDGGSQPGPSRVLGRPPESLPRYQP